MGESGNYKYDKNSFLLKHFIVLVILLITSMVFSERGLYPEAVQPFKSLIEEKLNILESEFPDKRITVLYKDTELVLTSNEVDIYKLSYDNMNRITLVSMFMKVQDLFGMQSALMNNHVFAVKSESIFEYPFIDNSGRYLLYISDKNVGNRNPFIFDLKSMNEREIIIPQSSEYFPVYSGDFVFFISGERDYYSLQKYSVKHDTSTEIAKGQITCLRIYEDDIMYTDYDQLIIIDSKGNRKRTFQFDGFIQSFSVIDQMVYLSMNTGTQYDIFQFSLKDQDLLKLTDTKFNEVDINNYKDNQIIFSSNQNGIFNLYQYNLNKNKAQCILEDKTKEYYYPFYSERYNSIIVSVFENNKEPGFSFIPVSYGY